MEVHYFLIKKNFMKKQKVFSKNGQHQTGLISSGINSRLDTIQATILLQN